MINSRGEERERGKTCGKLEGGIRVLGIARPPPVAKIVFEGIKPDLPRVTRFSPRSPRGDLFLASPPSLSTGERMFVTLPFHAFFERDGIEERKRKTEE